MTSSTYDIVIVGGGIVGLTLACLLAKQTRNSIGIVERENTVPQWKPEIYSPRVSAITLSSQQLLKSINVWPALQERRLSPFRHIEVWDASNRGRIEFHAQEIAEPVLGFIVENILLHAVLFEKISSCPQIDYISPVQLLRFNQDAQGVMLETATGRQLHAQLVVAADGAHSWLRQAANIEVRKKDYKQMAIIANVKTQLAHQQVARQIFLRTGPLAFLPLRESHQSSIVWTLPQQDAENVLQLSAEAFAVKLTEAFAHTLGEIESVSDRQAFPLIKQDTCHYVKAGLALVGDAAHTVHPLAGQGVNMGLADVASLSAVIRRAQAKQQNFASLPHLRAYERWRKADNLALTMGIDMLQQIFAQETRPFPALRACGLNLTNHLPWLKNIFMRKAVGHCDYLRE